MSKGDFVMKTSQTGRMSRTSRSVGQVDESDV
jgi:hypothetical protein